MAFQVWPSRKARAWPGVPVSLASSASPFHTLSAAHPLPRTLSGPDLVLAGPGKGAEPGRGEAGPSWEGPASPPSRVSRVSCGSTAMALRAAVFDLDGRPRPHGGGPGAAQVRGPGAAAVGPSCRS
ncbi:hypothetical protein P7K49_027618 [Saguinus oedipus]|uniref:Uncharacterized protein n=1 Tax=Saguinus oedipus TaxID=9490 RepID=A0ABQ9UAV2_SAGOE|nr:hypothetical protein P7K49_027618 [Saguinus oedipus]